MICGSFSYNGVRPIHPIRGIIYVGILEEVILPFTKWNMPLKWIYQQDNDPKHRSKLAIEWFRI